MSVRWSVPSALCAALLWFPLAPLVAQDRFDTEVYGASTEPAGVWELETQVSYTLHGTQAFDGGVAPTEHQGRLALELTRGLTDVWEISGYFLGATHAGGGVEYAGWRARTRLRAPRSWQLPVDLAFSAEMEFARPAFSESSATLELTPVIERRWGLLLLGMTPALERDLKGPESSDGWELEPGARVALDLSPRVTLLLEYRGSVGHLSELFRPREQGHQLQPGVALHVGDELTLHLGAGIGLGAEGDRFSLHTRMELPLAGE